MRITDQHYGLTLALWRCSQCGFIFADGRDLSELTSLYERLADAQYEETQDTRLLQMRWLLSCVLKRHPGANSLLDIGAGAGLLVNEARKRGLDATGVEPSKSLVEAASRVNGVQLLQGTFPHPALAGRTFDIVCLVDVIEHVADPIQLLRDCAAALNKDGVFVLVTPDVKSIAARLLGHRWWHFRLAHVSYFDRKTLTRALHVANLSPRAWLRAKWFFRVDYLAGRLAEYLPLGWFNRMAARCAPLRWIYRRVVPFTLFDSWLVIAQCRPQEAP